MRRTLKEFGKRRAEFRRQRSPNAARYQLTAPQLAIAAEDLPALHATLSGMKATSTVLAHDSIEECRKCCGGQLCDFCYDMSGACPACGVAVKDGKPLAEVDVEEPIDLSELDAEAAEAERQRRLKREITQELLECRICLNPGVRRKCCDGCVCDACYSKRPTCPVCGKDAAKRVRRTEAEQQRDAAVTAGLVNALGGTQPPQKPEQLVLDGREPRGGEKRKQLFVAALFASFVYNY